MGILPTDIQILFTNYDIITYALNLASCSEHFISIKHRILATFNINKKIQFWQPVLPLNTVNISQPNFFLTLLKGLKDFWGLFSFNFRLFSLTKELETKHDMHDQIETEDILVSKLWTCICIDVTFHLFVKKKSK